MRLLHTNHSATRVTGLLCGLLLAHAAFAQSNLSTIQDTLFKADGTRFTGTITIRWSTFDATNIGTIVQQSKAVSVSNGNLMVQLAPNAAAQAPANAYTVLYQSDGLEQFTETWSVPSTTVPLKVADVRTAAVSSTSSGTSGSITPIPESSVIGLTGDLAQRPVKGPGFSTGSVATINGSGQIETVVGNVGDCVYADGTTGTCGSPAAQFFDAEIPGGIVDGSNTSFSLANPPSGQSLLLFRNGLYMKAGLDYTLSGQTITFVSGAQPQPQDTLVASYRIDPVSGLANLSTGPQPKASVMAQVLCSANGRTTNRNVWASLGACDIPAASIHPGDRFEVRFTFSHTGSASGFAVQVNWGTISLLARTGGVQDGALAGQAEVSISATGGQATVQSWGTVLGFLPSILNVPPQNGLKVDLEGKVLVDQSDSLSVESFTVLRYPAH